MVHFSLPLSFTLLARLSQAQEITYASQSCVNVGGNPNSFAAVLLFQNEPTCFCIPPGGYGYPIMVSAISVERFYAGA
jgi:hypothetical protein